METFDNKTESVDTEQKKPLVIFKTEVDRYGRDITAMSDFFELYAADNSNMR